jgi:glycosyltransferase involved in cell wall biosynthesis
MKATIITSYYPPDVTSISYYYENLAHDLTEYGVDVTVVCGIPTRLVDIEITNKYVKNPIERVNDKLKIIRTGPNKNEGDSYIYRIYYHFLRSYCIYRKARMIKSDVYIIISAPPQAGFFTAKLSKIAPVVYDLHDIYPDALVIAGKMNKKNLLIKILNKIQKRIYIKCNKIRTVSNDMIITLEKRGVPKNKISVIYNWVDETKINHIEKANNPLFDVFGLSKEKFTVCYAGNIGLLQNMATMINAAEFLQYSHPDIQFVIIGDGAWKPEMLKRIFDKRLNNVFVFPMQSQDVVPYVYNLGDVGVVTIAKDVSKGSMPSKTWSILSAARPVICEVDLYSELAQIINKNKCGVCVSPDDFTGFSQAILNLYTNQALLIEYGNNGRKYIEKHVSRKSCTRQYYKLVCDVYKNKTENGVFL